MRGSKKNNFNHTLFAFGDIKNRKQDNNTQGSEEENKMDKKFMNKMDGMEMDKVAGGRCNPGGSKKRPRPSFHDSNANSMAAKGK